ncbi:ABC transporter ATP-binding protein [Helcococcus sueciensis]|uniref:ABC transporter ATP-binding protein n=1 Tax=Helcococcus sueciensis TaxID=241555 RepID=UPI0004049F10|nr:ABC transporter ATP-binding protein [Helcococcus sueciensis]
MKAYKTISRLIKEAWKIDKTYFVLLAILAIFESLISIASMYLPASVIAYLEKGESFKSILYLILAFVGGIYLLKQISEFIKLKYQKRANYQSEMLAVKLSEKTMDLSYDNLEDPKVLDFIQRAKMPISWGFIELTLEEIKDLLVALTTIFGLLVILFTHSIIYTLAILVILTLSTITTIHMQKKNDSLMQENVPLNRKYGYFLDEAAGPTSQKEYRIYGISKIWISKILGYRDFVFKWVEDLIGIATSLEVFRTIFASLITFIAIAYNGTRLISDIWGPVISIATFTLVFNSTDKLVNLIQAVSKSISGLNTANAHLSPWKDYIDLKEFKNTGNRKADELESLEFRNVYFSYPNTDRLILEDVSFKIDKGEKISIVGLNNAGKSTIVKLISRFYEPDKGQILWNGVDIREYDINSYIEQISAVFQDFTLMPYTIFENIMPGSDDRKEAEESLKGVNMYDYIESLPKKMDTYLDKSLEKDATHFSGGQAQKLAIARAINKGGSLMIMDEPTAALDPIAESEIFEKFAELTKNKTSIFISHRMSSSTFSDKVLLIDGGKVAAYDHHSKLMKGHNLYRELFETQAKNYI